MNFMLFFKIDAISIKNFVSFKCFNLCMNSDSHEFYDKIIL